MAPHEPSPNDYEPISKLTLNLDFNEEEEKKEKQIKLPLYQIVVVNMENNTVPCPEPLWDFEQLPIPIFENQNVFFLVPNE